MREALSQEERAEIQHHLDCLQRPYKQLNAWELDFLTSVTDQFNRSLHLTEHQREKLKDIYEKKA